MPRNDLTLKEIGHNASHADSAIPGKGFMELVFILAGMIVLGLCTGVGFAFLSGKDIGDGFLILMWWMGTGFAVGGGLGVVWFLLVSGIVFDCVMGLVKIKAALKAPVVPPVQPRVYEPQEIRQPIFTNAKSPDDDTYEGERLSDLDWWIGQICRNGDYTQETWENQDLPSGDVLNKERLRKYVGFLEHVGVIVGYGRGTSGKIKTLNHQEIMGLLLSEFLPNPIGLQQVTQSN